MSRVVLKKIVVLVSPHEKKFIFAKAKKLGLTVADLMCRGVFAYNPPGFDKNLGALADEAKNAANRASDSIDDVLAFIAASEKRIAAMEAKALRGRKFE